MLQALDAESAAAIAAAQSSAAAGSSAAAVLVGPRMIAPPVSSKEADAERRAKRLVAGAEPDSKRVRNGGQRLGVPAAVVPPFEKKDKKGAKGVGAADDHGAPMKGATGSSGAAGSHGNGSPPIERPHSVREPHASTVRRQA